MDKAVDMTVAMQLAKPIRRGCRSCKQESIFHQEWLYKLIPTDMAIFTNCRHRLRCVSVTYSISKQHRTMFAVAKHILFIG